MQGYFNPNDPAKPLFCPVCREWLSGKDRFEHMKRHVEPATASRIESELGVKVEDFFLAFCIQQGFDLDGLSPDDPQVTNAIAYWKVGGDFADADVIGEVVERDGRRLVVVEEGEEGETYTFDLGDLTFAGEVGDVVSIAGRQVEGAEGLYLAGDVRIVEEDGDEE